MVEVVALTGTFAHACKHGVAAVSLSDVVDELHHVHGLAHTGTAEQTDLAALGKRADKVNNLNAGFQELNRRAQFVELRGFAVNRHLVIGLDLAHLIDRLAKNVHDAAEGAFTNRNGDFRASGVHLHATLQTIGRTHGDAANDSVTKLLFNFKSQTLLGELIVLVRFKNESLVDLRHLIARELHVHHSADDLNDLSDIHYWIILSFKS